MNIGQLLKTTLQEIRNSEVTFAIAGGFAANLYRKQNRVTGDVDFLIMANSGSSITEGKSLLQRVGLVAGEVKLHNLTRSPAMNKSSKEVWILVGRSKNEEDPGIDLLLPPFPWFENALRRAQFNLVDFGFGRDPTLCVEDVILAKLFAKRSKDIDDLVSIFEAKCSIDLNYLTGEIERLKLKIPKEALDSAPRAIRVLSKRMRTSSKKSFP